MNLAIIPARGGSRGIPGKNLRKLAGRTLVEWAVLAARQSALVDGVAITTESGLIADEAHRLGVPVIYRPEYLSTHEAPLDAVLAHAIEATSWKDTVVLLQPTVPFRQAGLVDECIRSFDAAEADSLFTAQRLHFVWMQDQDGRWASNAPHRPNRQDFPKSSERWAEDGAVFVFKAGLLRKTGCRIGGRVIVHSNPQRTIDIDEPGDLRLAEAILSA